MLARRWAWGLLIVVLMFSSSSYDPYEETNRQRKPIPVTRQLDSLWKVTETCLGRTGDLSTVRFYAVYDNNHSMYIRGNYVLAYWLKRDNSITFHKQWMDDPEVIKHEMIHALRQDGLHLERDYEYRCNIGKD